MGSAPSRTSMQLLSRSFVPVLLQSPLTARMAAEGLRDACKERPKPKEAGEKIGKVAPFHRILCQGGRVEIVQAWTKGEARSVAKNRGLTLARAKGFEEGHCGEPVQSRLAG